MTAEGVRVRDAVDADAEAVAAIYGHYAEHSVATFDTGPRSAEAWRRSWADYRRAGWPVLVAESAGRVCGIAYVSPWRDRPAYRHTVESTVYLHPETRGRGVGTLLYRELLARAAEAGALQVIAVIAVSEDTSSPALHASLGYVEVGRLPRVGRKFDRWIDISLMQLSLEADQTG